MRMMSFAKVSSEILFTIFLSLLIIVFALANFTSYENLKPVFLNIAKQQINMTPQQLNSTYTTLMQLCKISGNETLYVESLEIKCSDIFSSTPENLPELIGSSTFEKIYFKKYDCQFFQCISLPGQDKFLFLLSEQANTFFKKSIIYLELIVVLSAVILIASIETWSGRFKALGLSLIFVGAADFVIILLKGLMMQNLPQQIAESADPIINQILDSVSNMYLIIFIAGVVLFIIGFVMSYLSKRRKVE
jgi:hypothetical protein